MARKTKIVTIETGRDAGKRFEITEPSAFDGERLYLQISALIGDDDFNISNLMKKASKDDGLLLWGRLLDFVKIIPSNNDSIKRAIDKDDIEDFSTLIKLRMEALSSLTVFTQE